ncbi:MAG: TMEM175 family protein, partial [Syntrophobacterales bacterium]
MKTENKLNNLGKNRRVILQLARLETLTDVVYAIVIWRIFVLIPKPGEANWHWESIGSFLTSNVFTFALVIIALAITIIYWLQNNALFGNLERTDGLHTAISILQLFFLLIFLYSIRLGVVLGASTATRAFESCAAALLGIASVAAWFYATKNRRLLASDVTQQDANALSDRIMAEPITAILTLPCAFIGPVVWEISWLSYL